MVHWIHLLVSIFFLPVLCSSQDTKFNAPLNYVVPHRSTGPELDGIIESNFWRDIKWSGRFQDIQGNNQPKPKYDTRFKAAYTDEALYIAARIEDPHIWANLKEKNTPIFRYDKNFEVFIDPDGDHCNYYELELNALNTIWELSLPFPYRNKGKPKNPDNMASMESAVSINGTLNDPADVDSFWTVEIKLPFEEFKKYNAHSIPPRPGDVWRVNFSRVQWDHITKDEKYIQAPGKKENNWVWSPQYEINMHAPEQWGYLYFDRADNKDEIIDNWMVEMELIKLIMKKKQVESSNLKIQEHLDGEIYSANHNGYQYFINTKNCFWTRIITE